MPLSRAAEACMETVRNVGDRRARELLSHVAQRRRTASLGAHAYLFILILTVVYALLLVFSRVLALYPGWFTPVTVLAVPGAAVLLSLVFSRTPGAAESARLVDTRAGTDDLFLTAVMIEESAGEYKPLVIRDAEEKAGLIEPRKVVPYRWAPKARIAVLVLMVLLAAVLFLPQWDPFGREEQRQRAAQREERLKDSQEATQKRIAVLKKKKGSAPRSEEVEKAVNELKKTLNEMKPAEKKKNTRKLQFAQKELGKLWRKTSQEKLKDALGRDKAGQSFGKGDPKNFTKWKQELREGSASSIKKELARLQRLTRDLEKTPDPVRRQKLREQIRRSLEDLARFSEKELKSRQLSAAIARALEQLDMSGLKGLSKEALEALRKTMKLTQEELERLAQAARDLKSLEETLKMLQLARRLNDLKGIDGKG
jgi:hypothetical protein